MGRRDEEAPGSWEPDANDVWEDLVRTGRRYPGTPMAETSERLAFTGPPNPPSIRRYPLIIDTDLGGDPDDMFALILAAKHEPNLALVVTSDEREGQRARLARHLLNVLGRPEVPVVAGIDLGSTKYLCFDGLISDSVSTQPANAVDAIVELAARTARPLRWLGIGPMSNLAAALKIRPALARQLRVVQMGGAVNYRKPGQVEHNFRMDIPAASYVVPLLCCPKFVLSDTTFRPEIEITETSPLFQRLEKTPEEWARLLIENCRQFFTRFYPGTRMHDPLTLTAALELPFVDSGFGRIHVNEAGFFSVLETAPLRPATSDTRGTEAFYSIGAMYEHFMAWFERSLFAN